MTAAQARRPTAQSAAKLASPAAADLISMFAQRNPKSSRGDLAEVGKLVAEFSVTAANLSPAARKRLIARKERFKKLIVEIAAEPEAAAQPLKLVANAAAEVSQGAGLGRVLSPEEGKARIAEYATPTKVEDWAVPSRGRRNWSETLASPAQPCTLGKSKVRSSDFSSAYVNTPSRRSNLSMGVP